MLETKFKIGDVVYFYTDEGGHYGLYKNFIKSITISTCDIFYAMDDSIGGSRSINEINLFLDMELCKGHYIEKRIQIFKSKIDLVPYLAEKIKLIDRTKFGIGQNRITGENP